ncbi:MAG: methionyl-tRNA formyltransferase [candidate division NC10 bacterium]
MRIIFMGSPTFAVPSLTRLVDAGHTLSLVVTQPDRPAGRGRDLRPSPVKLAAERLALPLAQPERLSDPDVLATLQGARPDVIVVVAFGQFLPQPVRERPPLGCINLHASLLPKYRGAAPIHRAVMAGETETGVTIMRVERRMDTGSILLQRVCPISPTDDAGSLHDRLSVLGAEALTDALSILTDGRAVWTPQDESRATLAPKLGDQDCRLEIRGDPVALVNHIRGLSPSPGAYLILLDGRRIRILKAEASSEAGPPGVILRIDQIVVVLGTGTGAVALREVQPEGKRRMTGAEFAHGRHLCVGARCV